LQPQGNALLAADRPSFPGSVPNWVEHGLAPGKHAKLTPVSQIRRRFSSGQTVDFSRAGFSSKKRQKAIRAAGLELTRARAGFTIERISQNIRFSTRTSRRDSHWR
jgi:hypothetical protein